MQDDVLWHVQKNKCNCTPEIGILPSSNDGVIGYSRGTGSNVVMNHTVDLGTGHYGQVQVGTKTETGEVGGHWEAR